MSDFIWLAGLALVLGTAWERGGWLLLIVVAVAVSGVFKVLGDKAGSR